jgi:glyoxylase-like metal-dependent hydrolase (beta-lactamase superfamily II)
VLVDTGLKHEPEAVILPALRALGVAPARLDVIVNSHADVDHNGGNAAVLAHCPNARLACGGADREMIESDQALWDGRWNQMAADHGIAYPDALRAELGPGTPVDWILSDGDVLALGGGRSLEVFATPGHSLGHLSFMLRPDRILFCGDTIQAETLPPGEQKLTPQYLDPEIYLGTLARLVPLRPRLLLTCHLGAFRGAEIKALLGANRLFVRGVEQELRTILQSAPGGLTLQELTYRLSRAVGRWEEADDINFALTVNGHVQHGLRQGWIGQAGEGRPLRYQMGGGA